MHAAAQTILLVYHPQGNPKPLPGKMGTTRNVFRTFARKPKPKSGLDCLLGAIGDLAESFET